MGYHQPGKVNFGGKRMKNMKKIIGVSVILAAILIAAAVVYKSGYYARHYAFDGFSDKITVFLYDGDAVVQNTKYDLKVYPPCGEEVVSRTSDGFSVNGGEYGLYFFALQYNEKTAEFGLENANYWWRTSIILRLSEDGSGLEQVNCVFNNNPPFIETRKILWKES